MTAAIPPAKPSKKIVDWDGIEPHYRAGVRSLKDIGREFDVSDAAIIKHARDKNWTRNLKAKVQARADALVSAAMVSAQVSEEKAQTKRAAEAKTIEVEATVQSRIRLAHRSDIARARELGMHLFAEVEQQTLTPVLLQEVERVLAGIPRGMTLEELPEADREAARAKLSSVLAKATALDKRTSTYKALVDALARLIGLEREAYAINADDGDIEDPLAKLLHSLKARTIQPVADDPDHA